eukprot:Opistho-2@72903
MRPNSAPKWPCTRHWWRLVKFSRRPWPLVLRVEQRMKTEKAIVSSVAALDSARAELRKARSRNRGSRIHTDVMLTRRQSQMKALAESGGSLGTMEYLSTGRFLPILIGGPMFETSEGREVVVVDVTTDKDTNRVVPLGGLMPDAVSGETVPIIPGARMMNFTTGKVCAVAGAKLDPRTGRVVPVPQVMATLVRREPQKELLDALEDEVGARRSLSRRQRLGEQAVRDGVTHISAALLADPEAVGGRLRELNDAAREQLAANVESFRREVKRRADAAVVNAMVLPEDVSSLLTSQDAVEQKTYDELVASYARVLDSLAGYQRTVADARSKFTQKMDELREAHNPDAEEVVRAKFGQKLEHLKSEFVSQYALQKAGLRVKDACVELLRDKADVNGAECRVLLRESVRASALEFAEASGSGGLSAAATASSGAGDDIGQPSAELIRLLERLIVLIQEAPGGLGMALVGMATASGAHTATALQSLPFASPFAGGVALSVPQVMAAALAPVERSPFTLLPVGSAATTGKVGEAAALGVDFSGVAKSEHSVGSAQNLSTGGGDETDDNEHIAVMEKEELEEQITARRANMTEDMQAALQETDAAVAREEAIEHQVLDRIKLADELKTNELREIGGALSLAEVKRREAQDELNRKMEDELTRASSEDERRKILQRYEAESEALAKRLDADKEAQMKSLRDRLAQERVRRTKKLSEEQKKEAEASGIVVPASPEAAASKAVVEQELQVVQERQQTLIAEMAEQEAVDTAKIALSIAAEEETKSAEIFDEMIEQLVVDGKLSAEERTQVLDQHKAGVAVISTEFDGKMQRQVDLLRERMAKRKANKVGKMRGDHQKELKGLADDGSAEAQAVRQRQVAETQALLRQLAAEEADEKCVIISRLNADRRRAVQEHQSRLLSDLLKYGKVTPADTEQLLRQHQDECAQLASALAGSKRRQADMLHARLEARKRMKEQKMVEEVVAKQIASMEESVAAVTMGEGETHALPEAVSEATNSAAAALPQDKTLELDDRHEEAQVQLCLKHQDESRRLHEELEAESKAEEVRMNGVLDKARERAMRDREARIAELNRNKDTMPKEEYERLLKAHQEELANLEKNIDGARQQQQAALKAKLEARRRQKEEAQRLRHENEREEAVVQHQQEMLDLESRHAKEAERMALSASLDETDDDKKEGVIYKVLQRRHLRETAKLGHIMEDDRRVAVAAALAAFEETAIADREKREATHEQELVALAEETVAMRPEEATARRKVVEERHAKEIAELVARCDGDRKHAERIARQTAEVKLAHAQLALKERHYKEMAQTFREFTPEQAMLHRFTEEGDRKARELKEFMVQHGELRKAELERIKAERMKGEEAEKRRLEAEVARFERELDDERQREVDRQNKLLEAKKLREMKEQEERQKKELEGMGAIGEDERKRILEQHAKDLVQLASALDGSKAKQQEELRRKLEAKKAAKVKRAEEEAENKRKELERIEREKLEKLEGERQREEAERNDKLSARRASRAQLLEARETEQKLKKEASASAANVAAAASALEVQQQQQQQQAVQQQQFALAQAQMQMQLSGLQYSWRSERDILALLMASPLAHKSAELERVVLGALSNGGAGAVDGVGSASVFASGSPAGDSFIDL